MATDQQGEGLVNSVMTSPLLDNPTMSGATPPVGAVPFNFVNNFYTTMSHIFSAMKSLTFLPLCDTIIYFSTMTLHYDVTNFFAITLLFSL